MKKFLSIALALILVVSCFAACGKNGTDTEGDTSAETTEGTDKENTEAESEASGDTIKVGAIGCYTGDNAQYGLGVRNGIELYIDKVNADGGINGKKIELIENDNKGDNAEAINAFNLEVDKGITALLGDVLTGNTIAVAGEAVKINMPMISPSATGVAATYDEDTDTVYSNVFRTCFTDPYQGEKMAEYVSEKLEAKTAAILYQTGDDYSVGLKDAFIETCKENGVEIVAEEGFAEKDVDFKSQLTTIASKNPDVVFVPNYYAANGLIIDQAREVGVDSTFVGGDGMNGIKDYAEASNLEGSYYCSGYAPGSSDEIKAFEEAYIDAYDMEPNMFAVTAYDAAIVMCNALAVAEEQGLTAGTDEYKQAVIDAIRDDSGELECITNNGYTFDEHNNPVKDVVIMQLQDGEEVFVEKF